MKRQLIVASFIHSMGGLHDAEAEVIRQLGYQHVFWMEGQQPPEKMDILFLQGPYGAVLPVVQYLNSGIHSLHPKFIYWFQQSLEMRLPGWMRDGLSYLFADTYRYDSRVLNFLCKPFNRILRKGSRLRFWGDILWLARHGYLDVLGVTSTVYADELKKYGIRSTLVQRGYHPSYGSLLNLERDIDVIWMGKTRTARRKRIVYGLRDALSKMGLKMLIFDGGENGFIFGEERTKLLNRTRFVLNIYPHPTWELSIRFFISGANGAVNLTEPGKNKYPFESGVHLVECPVEEMIEQVQYYHQHTRELAEISAQMYKKITTELTLQNSIKMLFEGFEPIQ